MEELNTLKPSLQSQTSFNSNTSFMVWVYMGDTKVVTFINYRVTNNFIDAKLIDKVRLQMVDTLTYVIDIGNGEKVRNQ